MPVYIGKNGDLVGCYRGLTTHSLTDRQQNKELLSLKFKLSHTIHNSMAGAMNMQEEFTIRRPTMNRWHADVDSILRCPRVSDP